MNKMKLQNEVNLDIPVSEMKDGEIGIITKWAEIANNIGKIVQRYGNEIICLQRNSGESWSNITNRLDCRVRILQKGEILIIE